MLYIGVDPGKAGALAALNEDGGLVWTQPMPVLTSTKGGRSEFDLPEIKSLLQGLECVSGPRFVTVEKLQPLPPTMGGSVANFSRGVSRGFEWMLVALGIPYQLVAPQTWQKAMHLGTPGEDTKQRSIIAAQRLFPSADLLKSPRCRKPDDGLAEALLLAEFGRRVRK